MYFHELQRTRTYLTMIKNAERERQKKLLLTSQANRIQIKVKRLDGKGIRITVSKLDMVEGLRQALSLHRGVNEEDVCLFFHGRVMDDGQSLQALGLETGSVVYMYVKHRR